VAGNDIILGVAIDSKKAIESLNSFQSAATKVFGAVAAVAAAAFASRALFSGIEAVTSSANEQVNAISRLNASLNAAGDYSKAASESMQSFAKSLSATIAVDDDVILQNLALAKSFGATNEQATALVTAASDLSAAMGTSLDEAVTQLGGTLSGVPGRLSKIAPELKNMSEEALKGGAAIKYLEDRFKGSAAAATQTFSGAMTKLSLSFDDFKTQIGFIITQNPAIRKVIQFLTTIFDDLAYAIEKNRGVLVNFVSEGISSLVSGMVSAIKVMGLFTGVLNPIKFVLASIAQGFSTLVFAARSLGRIVGLFNDIKDQEALVDANAKALFDSLDSLNNLKDFDLTSLGDSLVEQAVRMGEELQNQIDSVSKSGSISISADPTVVNVKGTKTEASKFGASEQAALGSTIVGAVAKGGKEGAIQVLGAVATAVAMAMGAGPFASVIGEIVTLFAGEGLPKLITSLIEAIPSLVETMAENMPLVAVALAKAFFNPAFYVAVINSFVDGLTKGIDAAFKILIKSAVNLFSVEIPKAIAFAVTSGIGQLAIGVAGAIVEIGTGIGNLFIELGNGIGEYLNKFVSIFDPIVAFFGQLSGGTKSSGEKVSAFGGKIKRGVQNPSFRLTDDTGTIQSQPSSFSLTGNSGGGDISTALLSQILNALNNPISVKSSVQLNGNTLADIMLELSRRNARLTA
jgi:hypothetical protein